MAPDDKQPEPEAPASEETDHALLLSELEKPEQKIEHAWLASGFTQPKSGPAKEELSR